MSGITSEEASLIRGLAAELGDISPQDAADIAIDLFHHCLTKIAASTELLEDCPRAIYIDLDIIHLISPPAQNILPVTQKSCAFKVDAFTSDIEEADLPPLPPLMLTFTDERWETLCSWARRLRLTEVKALMNAIHVLYSMVLAGRHGARIFIAYREHSSLRIKKLGSVNVKRSTPPGHNKASLLN